MKTPKVNFLYLLASIVVVGISWLIHKFFQWEMSELLGYKTVMTLNSTYLEKGIYNKNWHIITVTAAGPVITIIIATISYFMLQLKNWNSILYLFLFTAFYSRFIAAVMNIFSLNDEGRISKMLDWGIYSLPGFVTGYLFLLLVIIGFKYKLKFSFQLVTLLFIILTSSIIILSDQFWQIRLL